MKSYLLFTLLCVASLVDAQTSIDAEIRPRTEYREGFQKPLEKVKNPSYVTLQRSRLSCDYRAKVINLRFVVQDSRVWGSSNTTNNTAKLDLFEGWAEYLIASGYSVQLGRQALKYDDQRLFSAANWSNTGTSHDLLLLKAKPIANLQIHSAWAYNNTGDTMYEVNYNIDKMYKTMGFLWSEYKVKDVTMSAIGIGEGLPNAKNYKSVYGRYTLGANLAYKSDSCIVSASAGGYYQKGRTLNASTKLYDTLSAFMFYAKAAVDVYKKNAIGLGCDYYSGTKSDAKAGNTNTFVKLYGANHAFNGNMEYWKNLPKAGLLDMYATLHGEVSSKISIDACYHIFQQSQTAVVTSGSGKSLKTIAVGKSLGSELDIIVDYKIAKEFALQAGYCRYFVNDNAKNLLGLYNKSLYNPQHWAYVMVTFKPNLYKTPEVKN